MVANCKSVSLCYVSERNAALLKKIERRAAGVDSGNQWNLILWSPNLIPQKPKKCKLIFKKIIKYNNDND